MSFSQHRARWKGVAGVQMGFGLYQEQTQRLVMTTQMKQAIDVLQYSSLDLNQYVADQVDNNPFAEYESISQRLQQSWTMKSAVGDKRGYPGSGHRTPPPLDQTIRTEITLTDMLEQQIRVQRTSPRVARAALFVVGCLDESGYLREPDDALTELLGESSLVVAEAIALLQSCDPPGIGARNLQECLSLQLSVVPQTVRSLVARLIDAHLEDVAAGRIPIIARALHVSTREIQDAVDALRKLEPRPGLAYRSGAPEYVIPDIVVERVASQYVVMSNDHSQPTVRISAAYRQLLQRPQEEEARQYMAKKLQAAEWLVRCLEQRRLTLYRVAEAIVDVQTAFFDHGESAMKPLTLRHIADKLGLHESTVSRATRGKYMQTPRGVYEMKFFFTAEIASDDGVTSSQAAKHHIRLRVEHEDARQPLSDDAIAHHLADIGIHISRRTVAKYREELHIPSSTRRRRYD